MLIADKKMWQQLMCLIVSCNYNNKEMFTFNFFLYHILHFKRTAAI